MLPEITIHLAGHVGRWHPRRVRDQAHVVWATWLRTAQQGIIGVYVLAKPGVELAIALPHGTWVRLQGTLHPLRVHALPDDPRVADDVASAPLLIHANRTTRARRSTRALSPLSTPALLQVRAGTRIAAGDLAPAAHLPDLYHLATDAPERDHMRPWSTVRGVVAVIEPYRYLRYVVTEDAL